MEKGSPFDRKQFVRYKNILGNNVPDKLDDFLELKYNNKTEYGKLKHAYRIVNQYENNSGNMDPMDVVRLHDEAVKSKANFTGKARKIGNMGIMELDGETYIANSQISSQNDPGFTNYKGEKEKIVLEPIKQTFVTSIIRHDRKIDSEYKLFEYASRICNDGRNHKIELLSEKAMCDSCKSVMKQFKERHPNVIINAVSHNAKKAKNAHNRNRVFEYDVKREYEKNENKG